MNAQILTYIEQGKALNEARDFEEAYRHLSRAIGLIEEDSKFLIGEEEVAELYLLRGSTLISENKRAVLDDPDVFSQVMNDYDQAVDLQPGNLLYRLIRGKLYLNCRFANYRPEARADFAFIRKADPNHVEALKNLGEVYSRDQAFDEAIHFFTLVLRLKEDMETYMMRALCYFKRPNPDYTAAALDFKKAQEWLPEREELYVWRAQCFQELGQIADAIAEYDQLIKLSPHNANYYVDRGFLKTESDPEGALEDYDQALYISPHPLAYNNRAYYYRQKGEFEQAIKDAKAALEADSSYSIAYATLAEIFADMGDRDQFYHYLELALAHYYEDIVDVLSDPTFEPYMNEEQFIRLIGKTQ